MRTIVFLHGLEGRPDGTKPLALRAAGLTVVAPDGRGLPLAARVQGGQAALDLHPGAVLVGSSYGGLAAAYLATVRPVAGLLLLAPALHHREPPVEDPATLVFPAALPVRILHATHDEVVPVAVSRALAARHPLATLVELEDAHDLRRSLTSIVAAALALASPGPSVP